MVTWLIPHWCTMPLNRNIVRILSVFIVPEKLQLLMVLLFDFVSECLIIVFMNRYNKRMILFQLSVRSVLTGSERR